MVVVLTVIQNKKENDILALALKQKSMKVISSEPNFANYVRSLQYKPDIIIMEMPAAYMDHMYFIRLLRKNKKTRKIPIISYGNTGDEGFMRELYLNGINKYYVRPLRFSVILHDFEVFLKSKFTTATVDQAEVVKKREQDFLFILDKEKLATEKIEVMVQYVGKLMAFPFTISKILSITKDMKSGAFELSRAIKADSAITTTILKVSNSVLFASRDRKISDIKEAIVRLGFNETKNIALSMSVMKMFSPEEKSMGYSRIDFWYHSLACGVIAEKIAKVTGQKYPEEAFVAGLLHDFGILLLDEFFSEIFEQIIGKTTENGTPFLQTAQELMGINQNDLVESLFAKWNIPSHIIFGIKNNLNFLVLDEHAEKPAREMAIITGLAQILAKTYNIGRECDQFVHAIPDDLLMQLKLPYGIQETFFDDVYHNINIYTRFLNLEEKKFPEEGPMTGENGEHATTLGVVDLSKRVFEPHLRYLKSQGYKLVTVQAPAELDALERSPDVLVVNTSSETPMDQIKPFFKVAKRGQGEVSDPAKIKNIPVVLFCDENTECSKIESDTNIKVLPKRIDLRNIDSFINRFVVPQAALLSEKRPDAVQMG